MKKILTTKELCKRWKCKRRKVDYFCFEGLLKFSRSGKLRIFKSKDITAFERTRMGVI